MSISYEIEKGSVCGQQRNRKAREMVTSDDRQLKTRSEKELKGDVRKGMSRDTADTPH